MCPFILPQTNKIKRKIPWKYRIHVLTDFHSNRIKLTERNFHKYWNIFVFSRLQIYTEWANYYLERAKSKRSVADLSGKNYNFRKLSACRIIFQLSTENSGLSRWTIARGYHRGCHQFSGTWFDKEAEKSTANGEWNELNGKILWNFNWSGTRARPKAYNQF